MAKASKAETSTKAATKNANDKTSKPDSSDKKTKSDKPKGKRAPNAYSMFVKDNMAKWKLDNPEKPHKDAMAGVAAMWKESDLNPNKGKDAVPKKGAKKAPASKAPSSSDTEA